MVGCGVGGGGMQGNPARNVLGSERTTEPLPSLRTGIFAFSAFLFGVGCPKTLDQPLAKKTLQLRGDTKEAQDRRVCVWGSGDGGRGGGKVGRSVSEGG